ncbi:hypothetical protein ACWEJ6_06785 [Nonomuraea sp. NPDC004702]
MRRLATHLGVAPMAPCGHVSGKDGLPELMVDHVHADLRVPDGLGRRPSLRALAVLTCELMLRQAELRDDLAPVMMCHMGTGRHPTFQHHLRTTTRKPEQRGQPAPVGGCPGA